MTTWKTILDRWLAAEEQGREPEAETALRRLFFLLPQPAPAPGFAQRVLWRLGPLPAGHSREPFGTRSVRAAIALSLFLVGLAVAYLPGMLGMVMTAVGSVSVTGTLADGLVALGQGMARTLDQLEWVVALCRALLLAAREPAVLAALGVATIMAVVAFRLLSDLLPQERY